MLASLLIKDVVLISSLELDFSKGLIVFTGETGAGKSVLLDSLGLALGARGDASMIKNDADKLIVAADFIVPENHLIQDILKKNDIPVSKYISLKRTINKDGRSKAFVNEEPVNVKTLKALGDVLVDVHGQFETSGLFDVSTHIQILDAFANLNKSCIEPYKNWQDIKRERISLQNIINASKTEEKLIKFNVDELEKLSVKQDEEVILNEKRNILINAEKITSSLNAAYAELAQNHNVDSCLRKAINALSNIENFTGEKLKSAAQALERANIEINDALAIIEAEASLIENNEGELNELEERLFALKDAARKHLTDINNLPTILKNLKQKLENITNGDEILIKFLKDEENAKNNYIKAAAQTRELRQNAAKDLTLKIMQELPELKLEKAKFKVEISQLDEAMWSENGFDKVIFTISTNPNTPFAPINKIASGGELSRIMLALKVNLAKVSPYLTLVFDEVDSGVGGATASAVGSRLAKLANEVQVMVVTHSPQVASKAASHFKVEKNEINKDNVQITIKNLKLKEEKLEEVARMMSGEIITNEARAAALALFT